MKFQENGVVEAMSAMEFVFLLQQKDSAGN